MNDAPIEIIRQAGRVDIVLSRPKARNALNPRLREALDAALESIAASLPLPAVMVLRAKGPAFCAGADLKERPASAAWTWEERWCEHRAWSEVLRRLRGVPCTTVAVVEGGALGGGALLALNCDIRLGGSNAFFQFPEAAFGLPLPWDGPRLLSRLAGADWAREVVLTGRRISCDEALRKGLLHRLADQPDVSAPLDDLCGQLERTPARVSRAVKASFAPAEEYGDAWLQADLLASAVERAL